MKSGLGHLVCSEGRRLRENLTATYSILLKGSGGAGTDPCSAVTATGPEATAERWVRRGYQGKDVRTEAGH